MNDKLQKVRIDKWLWAVRIFKSRTLAADACKSSKVKINGLNAKASDMVQRGALIQVKKEGFNMVFKVVDLLEKRVSASLAEPCYENLTPPEEMNKFKSWYLANSLTEVRDRGTGRPTKKERRDIDGFKTTDEDEDMDLDFPAQFFADLDGDED